MLVARRVFGTPTPLPRSLYPSGNPGCVRCRFNGRIRERERQTQELLVVRLPPRARLRTRNVCRRQRLRLRAVPRGLHGARRAPGHGRAQDREGPAVPPARVRARNVDVAGAEFKRRATKWGCPTGECKPASTWIEADRRNPLVPGSTRRFRDLYAGRAAVEREFGRLKHEYGLTPLRIRGLARVSVPLAV